MRRAVCIQMVVGAIAACSLCAGVAGASWHPLEPDLETEHLDTRGDEFGLAADPVTGLPHIAYFYNVNASGFPRTWKVRHAYFDGTQWHHSTVDTLQDALYGDGSLEHYLEGISLALSTDASGNTKGGLAYVYYRHDTKYDPHRTTRVKYAAISTVGGQIQVGMGQSLLGVEYVEWVSGYFVPLHDAVSVAFNTQGLPGVAFTINYYDATYGFPRSHSVTQLCYRYQDSLENWHGTEVTTYGYPFDDTVVTIDSPMGSHALCAGLSLAMDDNLAVAYQPRVAYSLNDSAGGPSDIRYATLNVNDLDNPTISHVAENVPYDSDYEDTVRVSLALDPDNSNNPCIAYEAGDLMYTEWEGPGLDYWLTPETAYNLVDYTVDHVRARVGSLCIDAECGGTRLLSVGHYDTRSVGLKQTYVMRREGTQWPLVKKEKVMGGWPYWRPVMDIPPFVPPVYGAPLVGACGGVIFGDQGDDVGAVMIRPVLGIHVSDKETEEGIPDATVYLIVIYDTGSSILEPDSRSFSEYRYAPLNLDYFEDPVTHQMRPIDHFELSVSHPDYDPYYNNNVSLSFCEATHLDIELEPEEPSCATAAAYGAGRAADAWSSPLRVLLPLPAVGLLLGAWFLARSRRATTR